MRVWLDHHWIMTLTITVAARCPLTAKIRGETRPGLVAEVMLYNPLNRDFLLIIVINPLIFPVTHKCVASRKKCIVKYCRPRSDAIECHYVASILDKHCLHKKNGYFSLKETENDKTTKPYTVNSRYLDFDYLE